MALRPPTNIPAKNDEKISPRPRGLDRGLWYRSIWVILKFKIERG